MFGKDARGIFSADSNQQQATTLALGQKLTSPKWLFRCTLAFIVVGLGLRAYHFGRNPSVWHDEAALILNVANKSFLELLGPLYFAEAGPPLFLWLERAVRLILGDGVFALRFIPFAASCAGLLMVATTARRLLLPAAAPIAVLLFACSRSLLWHASEAKPYAVDVALAALLPMLVCGPLRTWSLERRLIFFALLAPLVVMLSYPGCFLIGGVVLSLLPEVWSSQRRPAWLAFLCLNALLGVSFLALLLGPIHAQRCARGWKVAGFMPSPRGTGRGACRSGLQLAFLDCPVIASIRGATCCSCRQSSVSTACGKEANARKSSC